MRPPDMRTPRGNGATRGKRIKGDTPQILRHPTQNRNIDNALPTVARRCLTGLATARREHRDTVSPLMSDAIDAAMDALSIAAGGGHGHR